MSDVKVNTSGEKSGFAEWMIDAACKIQDKCFEKHPKDIPSSSEIAKIIAKHAPQQPAVAKVELTVEDLDLIYHELAIRNCWYEKVPCTSEDLPEGLRHVAEGECNLPLCVLRRKLEEAKRGS